MNHDEGRDMYMGDAQDYAHKQSLRTAAPLRPASGREFTKGQRVRPLEPADAHSVGTVLASTHRYVAVLWDNGLGVPFWHRFQELQHQELGK